MVTKYVVTSINEGSSNASALPDQTIENKQKFISQIMTSKTPVRSIEDVDESTLSYSEIKALAAGNPLIKEKMEVDNKLNRLRTAKAEFLKSHEHLKHKVEAEYPEQIHEKQNRLEKLLADIDVVKNNSSETFSVTLNDKIFTDKQKAVDFIKNILEKNKNSLRSLHGEYKGLKFFVQCSFSIGERDEIKFFGEYHKVSKFVSQIPGNNLNSIVDLVEKIPENAESLRKEISVLQSKFDATNAE